MKMTNLNEKQDKIISQIKRNVEEDKNVFRKLNRAAAYGHQKHGQVIDLINAFENYTVDLIESHDENSRHMTRMEDETKQSEKEMEEHKVVLYEKLNNIDSHIYKPLNNICTEREKFLKVLQQMNSDAVISLEDMKITSRKGEMKTQPDEAVKTIIQQRYGKVGQISIRELITLLNNELKPNSNKDVLNYASKADACIASGNLSDETNDKYSPLMFNQKSENGLVYENLQLKNS